MNIPVAVKVSPFFSNFANMAKRLDETGANALVLFNRFYQPDIELEIAGGYTERAPQHADGDALAPAMDCHPLRPDSGRAWRRPAEFTVEPMLLKMLMAGADVTMLCSVLLRRGIGQIKVIEREMCEWMEQHQYDSVEQLKGSCQSKALPRPGSLRKRAIHAGGLLL